MHPVLIRIGEWRLFSYGALIAAGGALSTWFWLGRWKAMGLKRREDVWILVNAILLSGFLGGKILFLLEYDRTALGFNSGFSVMGAFASVFLGVWIFCRRQKIAFKPVLDYVCRAAPLWHSFGRMGCFMAGCCFGRPTSSAFGVVFSNPESLVPERYLGVPLHPAQLYEAAGDLAIFFGLSMIKPKKPGTIAGIYFISYAVLRFSMEFFRGDTVAMGSVTAGQLLSLGLVALGLACIRS